jgi:hypothetical protein
MSFVGPAHPGKHPYSFEQLIALGRPSYPERELGSLMPGTVMYSMIATILERTRMGNLHGHEKRQFYDFSKVRQPWTLH